VARGWKTQADRPQPLEVDAGAGVRSAAVRFRRLPVATAVVFVVTATTSVLGGLVLPGMLAAWQRTPQGLRGDWWRTVTALLVQDGGVVGTLSNLAFLEVRFRAEPRSPCLGIAAADAAQFLCGVRPGC
jgi:hypothetical protein